jgi:LAO/AO transport system kinase
VELRDWIESHRRHLVATGQIQKRQATRAAAALDHILRERLLADLMARLPAGRLPAAVDAVARREIDPYAAVERLLAQAGC